MHLGPGKHIVFLENPVMCVKVRIALSPYSYLSPRCNHFGHRSLTIDHSEGFILIEIFYTTAAALIKFSSLLLYRRIFDSNRHLMIACWVVAGIVFSYSTAQVVMSIFQCTPVHKAWEPATPGTCLDTFVAATTPAAINVVADFATVFLPMPLIWGMQLEWKRKVQITGIFMLGSLWAFGLPRFLRSASNIADM